MNPTSGSTPSMAPGADPLAQLRGLHLPDAIGLWPPAPGWWVLAVVVVALAAIAVFAIRRHRASIVRRALGELDRLATQPLDVHALAAAVSTLLRRVALVRFGRRAAGLHGARWHHFIVEQAPSGRRGRAAGAFSADLGRALALAPYAPPGALDFVTEGGRSERETLLAAARAWIRGNL